jgi:anthraniloyl-CoA monooxygenase
MRIVGIGAGPASLYFAILMKKAFPGVAIELHERNRADDTFGWGVVFSDETLDGFEDADAPSYAAIQREFVHWTDIENWVGDTCVRSTGHGFSGLARRSLLLILQDRARELGVTMHFESDITDARALAADCDLLLGTDGVNSLVRDAWSDAFQPDLDWRRCKFSWLGTTKPLEAFTFVFEETEHGLFQVHAYPFQRGERPLSTWIVECTEATWRRAGLDAATEEETVAYCERVFARHLDGHPLLANKSVWRTFPTVKNATYHHENVVLLGDAAHTAHFSIGSGTKLAMEDAVALVDAFQRLGLDDLPAVLADYDAARRDDADRLQHAAQTSLEWFENSERYLGQPPWQFMFNLMTRSKRITYDNLERRDPDLVEQVRDAFAASTGVTVEATYDAPPPAYTPFALRDLTLRNRIVVSPMCQYQAEGGVPNDWHFVHLGSLGLGGAGLLMTEATNVTADGRITYGCTGLYDEATEAGWARVLAFVREHADIPFGIQLGHAGRKASYSLPWAGDRALTDASAWPTLGPTAEPYRRGAPAPRAATRADLDAVTAAFVAATKRAGRLGFDLVELHMAHGYLLSSFLSPLSNRRTDRYGGSLENRMRYPLEVARAVRAAWPAAKPLAVRVSASDWLDDDGGQTIGETVAFARELKAVGVDLIDVSSAGNDPRSRPVYGRMYQVPFAEQIRFEAEMPVMAVGGIQGVDHVNTIVAAGRADLCAIARAHLTNPHLALEGSARYRETTTAWPLSYRAASAPPLTRAERRRRRR